jgi:hypothetical protein
LFSNRAMLLTYLIADAPCSALMACNEITL